LDTVTVDPIGESSGWGVLLAQPSIPKRKNPATSSQRIGILGVSASAYFKKTSFSGNENGIWNHSHVQRDFVIGKKWDIPELGELDEFTRISVLNQGDNIPLTPIVERTTFNVGNVTGFKHRV
jgi:hypothetical protein